MCIVKWGVKVLFVGGGFSPPADNMRDRRKESMKTMAGRRHRNFLSDATNSNQSRTHTDIVEGCAKHTYNTRPFENGSAGRREEGLASLTPCTKNEKNEVKSPFLIPERGAGKSALGEGEGDYPLMAKI